MGASSVSLNGWLKQGIGGNNYLWAMSMYFKFNFMKNTKHHLFLTFICVLFVTELRKNSMIFHAPEEQIRQSQPWHFA